MEQKTEASQAVDERALFEKSGLTTRLWLDNWNEGSYYGDPTTELMWKSWQARAALKAQPAPTEAPPQPCWSCKKPYTLAQRSYADGRCPHCDVDIELDDEASNKEQGEDSARLEFMMENGAWVAWSKDGESCRVFHRDEDGDPGPIMGWNNYKAWSHDPREAIDRARASAETGGVKS